MRKRKRREKLEDGRVAKAWEVAFEVTTVLVENGIVTENEGDLCLRNLFIIFKKMKGISEKFQIMQLI